MVRGGGRGKTLKQCLVCPWQGGFQRIDPGREGSRQRRYIFPAQLIPTHACTLHAWRPQTVLEKYCTRVADQKEDTQSTPGRCHCRQFHDRQNPRQCAKHSQRLSTCAHALLLLACPHLKLLPADIYRALPPVPGCRSQSACQQQALLTPPAATKAYHCHHHHQQQRQQHHCCCCQQQHL